MQVVDVDGVLLTNFAIYIDAHVRAARNSDGTPPPRSNTTVCNVRVP